MKKQSSKKKGILLLIFGTLAVIVGVVIFAFVTGQITGALVEARYGGTATYVMLTASIPCVVVCFVLLEAILFLQYLPTNDGNADPAQPQAPQPMLGERRAPTLNKKTVLWISLGLFGAVILCGAVSANTYTVVSESGISSHFFVDVKAYEWGQVSSYTVDCDSDKGLSVTYAMRDKKEFEVLQSPVSTTNTFDETYGNGNGSGSENTLAFAVHIDDLLQERHIRKNPVRNADTAIHFYRTSLPTSWEYVAQLIDYQDSVSSPDERPETVTDTDTAVPETTESDQ